jgi:16S rRNA (guanine966-N2)-methyltransferase
MQVRDNLLSRIDADVSHHQQRFQLFQHGFVDYPAWNQVREIVGQPIVALVNPRAKAFDESCALFGLFFFSKHRYTFIRGIGFEVQALAAHKTADKKKSRPGQLRIVAGNWRSRLLQIAEVPGLRPTSERIRETLFNWLTPNIHGARCLDLCAGTGALGLEALSRGARRAVFVEKSAIAAEVLKKNIAALGARDTAVLNLDAQNYLAEARVEPFDVVFLDPPFAAELLGELCRLLTDRDWLAANARIYIEADKGQAELFLPERWQVLKNKTAGNVRYMLAATDI